MGFSSQGLYISDLFYERKFFGEKSTINKEVTFGQHFMEKFVRLFYEAVL